MARINILVLLTFVTISLTAQESYKVVFEGNEHGQISRIVSFDENEFIAVKTNYPFNTKLVISSDIYTYNNDIPEDSLHWNLDFFRIDTAIDVRDVFQIENGGYIISGIGVHFSYTDTLIILNRFNWLMQLDNMKNVIWEKYYPLPDEVSNKSTVAYMNLIVLQTGNYLFAETVYNDTIPWIYNILIREINTEGYLVKTVLFDQSISGSIMSLSYNYDSSAIMLHKMNNELYDCANGIGAFILDIVNYDTIGKVCYTVDGPGSSYPEGFSNPYDAMLNTEGGLIVAGTYYNYIPSPIENYLGVKKYDTAYNEANSILLTDPDTTTYAAWMSCLDINTQGEICVVGSFDNALGFFTNYYDLVYLAKLDSDLNLLSERYIGRDAEYSVFCMAATSDGGIAVGGYQYDYMVNEENEGDPFIIKTDAGLWLDTPQYNELNVHRALVYPNPGNSELHIRTTVNPSVFKLFNMSGNIVLNVTINELITTTNTANLPRGAYWWVLQKHGQIVDRGKWIKY